MRRTYWEPLYNAVAIGMTLYAHAAFRVVLLGRIPRLRGHLLVSTHRSDADVPLLCSNLFFRSPMWRTRTGRPQFAARDDLFQRGVLAGLAPGLPGPLMRLLFPVDPGPFLPRVRVNPIRARASAKAAQALGGELPETLLADVLPRALVARFEERGVHRVGQASHADLSDLLWTDVTADELPGARDFWRRRANESTADLRRLISVVRAGEPLLLFPEGRPSPDGAIGPLEAALELLVRRGRPRAILPFGLAYDPLTRGKTRACVGVGPEFASPADDVDGRVLASLRLATPLTAGQVVAHRLLRGDATLTAAELDGTLAAAAERARAEGRPVDTALATTRARQARLTDCLASLVRCGVLESLVGRLRIDRERAVEDGRLERLAAEYESARVSAVPLVVRR